MPPHKKKAKKKAGHHVHHEWYVNNERTREVADFCDMAIKILTLLKENAQVTIAGEKIAPPDQCHTIIRYEQMPHGELCLKLELQWDNEAQNDIDDSDELDIE